MNKKNLKKSNQQNKKLIWAAIALVVVIVVSCILLAFINAPQNNSNQTNKNSDIRYVTYQTIGSNEVFTLLDEIGDKNILYVGRDTCPHCSAFAPVLIEAIQEVNAVVYYYDTAAARVDDVDKLNELMDILDVTSVPALLKIENGEVKKRLNDYEDKEAIVNFLK